MEYIILYCRRDQVWLVARVSARKLHVYITQAECFTEESAELLIKALNKKNDKRKRKTTRKHSE